MFEISEQEIIGRLKFDNPWWEDGDPVQVRYAKLPRRKYFGPFSNCVSDFTVGRAVVLMGPRRVGKTVMIYHTISDLLRTGVAGKNILYLSLETPLYTGLRLDKIFSMYCDVFKIGRTEKSYIFFDEVQYLKDWEVHLKSLVDSFPECKFIATGSAAAALRMKSNESGAGRFTDFLLPPLTFAEYLQFIDRERELISDEKVTPVRGSQAPDRTLYSSNNIEELNAEFVNYLNFGGYPEAVFSDTVQADPSQYIKSDIIDKVLLRDLPSLYGIQDIQELNRLFTVLAYNTGNEVSLEELSKTSGVAKNTIKRYMEYLEAAFLIKRVDRIDQSAKRFKRAMCFKVYLTNPSMRAALFGQVNAESAAMGPLTETAIFSQWQHSDTIELHYARWSHGEIDIVSLDKSRQSPHWIVEVKWSDRPCQDYSQLRHCVEFVQNHPNIQQPVLITTRSMESHITYKDVSFHFHPSSLYAYTLGVNILKFKAHGFLPPDLSDLDFEAPALEPANETDDLLQLDDSSD